MNFGVPPPFVTTGESASTAKKAGKIMTHAWYMPTSLVERVAEVFNIQLFFWYFKY